MKSNVIFLSKENQINKVLRDQRKAGNKVHVLFISVWDKSCSILVDSLGDYHGNIPLYVVNSFTMPHAFVIYHVTKSPTLVTVARDRYIKEDYLPKIYNELGCEPVTFSI
tara:strand:+ start:2422 stop:2751 length:330 start_codon:yes stop_codon:yes gene_type:complete